MLSMIITWFRRNETERDLVARERAEAREARWERREIGKARIQAQRDIARLGAQARGQLGRNRGQQWPMVYT